MAVRDTVFDLIIFGFLFVSPFIDRWLVGLHASLKGVFTALLMALFSYLSMWEVFRRTPLRRFRSQESLATALAASTVGLVFCLQRNREALVILVLSIGFMMGALVAAISIIGCILDWKLERGEWWFVGAWCALTAGAAAYLGLVRSMPSQAILLSECSTGAMCLLLFAMDPRRIVPLVGLVATVVVSVAWGYLCSQVVLIGTQPGTPYLVYVALVGFAGWTLFRMAVGKDAPEPDLSVTGSAVPAVVWLGPIGLALHRVFESRRVTPLQPSQVEADVVKTDVVETDMPQEPAPPAPPVIIEQRPFGVIFPGRLIERLALPVLLATVLNQFIH